MENKKVKDFMTSPAISCDVSTTIKNVISIMKENNIGFLPITKSDILVGVVTDRDVLIRSVGVYKLNSKINNVMTNGNIHFVSPETPILEAAKKMANAKIRRLVVLNDGKIEGVLTSKNLLSQKELLPYITETYYNSNTLPDYAMYENSNPHDSAKAADYPL